MTDDPAPPAGIDPNTPSSARVYDYLLGGKDNYASDRAVVRQYTAVDPDAPLVSRANRAFGMRAARFIAAQGVTQFLDLGSGIPTSPPNVHDTVWAIDPTARVVYVDYDPIAVAHSAALRSTTGQTTTILADIRYPEQLLDHPQLRATIDLTRPLGVLVFSVLQGIDDPAALLARYTGHLPEGSYLGISHMSDRSDPDAMARAERLVAESGFPPTRFRSDAEVVAMFQGFELVEPGLVEIPQWRPDQAYPTMRLKLVGGVGRKPPPVPPSRQSSTV